MTSARPHFSMPEEFLLELKQHPGINRSAIAYEALKKHIRNPKVCTCHFCIEKRKAAGDAA
jgi:hypothetical protein